MAKFLNLAQLVLNILSIGLSIFTIMWVLTHWNTDDNSTSAIDNEA